MKLDHYFHLSDLYRLAASKNIGGSLVKFGISTNSTSVYVVLLDADESKLAAIRFVTDKPTKLAKLLVFSHAEQTLGRLFSFLTGVQ